MNQQMEKQKEVVIDQGELREILEILENMENETLGVQFLRDLHDKTKELGELILNRDPQINHQDWQEKCRQKKVAVDQLMDEIRQYARD